MSTRRLIAPLSLAAITAPVLAELGPEARPKVIYTPIVLTGQSAPGGGTFSAFPYHSVIDDADHIVFLGSTTGPSYSPDGIFVASPTGNQLVAKNSTQAPGFAPGVTIGSFDINQHRVNTAKQVIFESWLAGPGIDNTGDDFTNAGSNWFWSNGQLQLIAQFETPAPGAGGAVFRWLDRTTLNDLGQVAFRGGLTGAGVNASNDSAFWIGTPGNLSVLAREGSPAPGGLIYGDVQGSDFPVLSPNGKVAFLANIGSGDPFFNRAFFAGTPGNLQLVAKSGQAAPGTNTTFGDIHGGWNSPGINDKGDVFFASTLNDGSRGIWAGQPGNLTLVGQSEQPAPGLGDAKYTFFYGLALNDKGQVAYRADFFPDDDSAYAIYAGTPHNPTLIAATGQHAPGTEEGVKFGYITDPVLNKDGQVAFFGYLTGANSRGQNDYGIFATGHDGDLRLIARFGDGFEVGPGDIRTIQALSHAGVFGTHILSFNADSNLVFLAKFTNGSEGIFTATVLPEPAALVTFFALSSLLAFRRRSSMR